MSELKRGQKRKKLAGRDRLTAAQKKGFKRRFVNADPERIQAFKDAGWQIVTKENLGEGLQNPVGSQAETPVGGGQTAVLMEIREDWWKEDQADKEAARKDRERSLLNDQDGKPRHEQNLEQSLDINHGSKVRVN